MARKTSRRQKKHSRLNKRYRRRYMSRKRGGGEVCNNDNTKLHNKIRCCKQNEHPATHNCTYTFSDECGKYGSTNSDKYICIDDGGGDIQGAFYKWVKQ